MTELKRYVRDLVRDGKLVYLVLDNGGEVELRRMRLLQEDRDGAPEWISCKLQEVEISEDPMDG